MAETGIITRMHPTVQEIAEQAWNALLNQQPPLSCGTAI